MTDINTLKIAYELGKFDCEDAIIFVLLLEDSQLIDRVDSGPKSSIVLAVLASILCIPPGIT